ETASGTGAHSEINGPSNEKKASREARSIRGTAIPAKGQVRARGIAGHVRETGRWIIPKGWPRKGKSPQKAAARRARDEAGVVGKINRRSVGSFFYEKRLKGGKVIVCEVQVFVLKVKRQQARWLEKGERKVKWLSRAKAAKNVGDRVLGTIIRTL